VVAFGRVFLGHIHTPSVEHTGRVIYVGAPMHFDFGDVGPRYAWVLDESGVIRPLPLLAPQFITAVHPRLPAPGVHGGFLRILGVPRDAQESARVSRRALDLGWSGVLPVGESVLREGVRALTEHQFADEPAIRAYIDQAYPDCPMEEKEALVTFGVECVREAQR